MRSRIGESLISKKLPKSMISRKKQKMRSRVGEKAEVNEKRDFTIHLEMPKWSFRVGESSILKILKKTKKNHKNQKDFLESNRVGPKWNSSTIKFHRGN